MSYISLNLTEISAQSSLTSCWTYHSLVWQCLALALPTLPCLALLGLVWPCLALPGPAHWKDLLPFLASSKFSNDGCPKKFKATRHLLVTHTVASLIISVFFQFQANILSVEFACPAGAVGLLVLFCTGRKRSGLLSALHHRPHNLFAPHLIGK